MERVYLRLMLFLNSLLSNARTSWVISNATGVNTSEGVEISDKWKPIDKKISLDFGYTFTDSYDAATCDQDEKDSYTDGECHDKGSKLDSAKVRVPRHAIQSKINGNTGGCCFGYVDQILTDYTVFDFETSYNFFDGFQASFNIENILDEKYEQAYQYSSMGRSFNFGIRKIY